MCIDLHDAPLLTSLRRVAAAAQVHTPEEDEQLTLAEVFGMQLVMFLMFLGFVSACILAGWAWQEYKNFDLAGVLMALGSLAPAY